ncbi:hypothetical protein NO559_07690 [Dasania sp. GY-MA-18]|uniref:Uncharacterized protein n=1 Tax=Dasania phycosphaerae TaxID=2950436 RepID=A0A9J6RK56_9GAMM|nr:MULTISPECIES: hypothetical protein [Dasania]MCR8922648.1 hypothetical protein [Dasania sp. GY-MA-18]MCZ0865078.1 hypothetical protein [Dasania phycosphaerae]MCZ0868804.1 hypothetical protein [Dasania phycosphaerae]
MSARINAAQRAELQNVAEREVLRYKGNHPLWHKHIHGADLDPMQVLKMVEMDEHLFTVDYSCRRTRKTSTKELWFLEYMACNADQSLGIIAPTESQSITNLNYHTDAIRRSPILSNFINTKGGRKQMADSYYQFANRSQAEAYGIMGQVDGDDLTIASIEEVDDLPQERLFSRFLLTMGATDRLGADKDSVNDQIIRITGVFKGADTLSDLIDSGDFHVLPVVDCYTGIELGVVKESFMTLMQGQLSSEEYIRQLLCQNIAAKNLIWEKWVRQALQRGLMAGVKLVEPEIMAVYKKRGLLSFGYDHTGHGEAASSSRSALVVKEMIGNHIATIFCKTWPPGTDEKIILHDLVSLWRYFMPDYAMGDAFGIGLLTALNDRLFTEGLTAISRMAVGGGESTASTWTDWAFAPLRFEGMIKHQMAQAVRATYQNGFAVLPYIDNEEGGDPLVDDMRTLQKQLINIKQTPVKNGSYNSYEMVKKLIGDDLFDADMAGTWALVTRGESSYATEINTLERTRQQLLGSNNLRQLGGLNG